MIQIKYLRCAACALTLVFSPYSSLAQPATDDAIAALLAGDEPQVYVAGERLWSTPYLRRIYADEASAPRWTDARFENLVAEIERATADGLDPRDFMLDRLAGKDALSAAERELLATEALARLAFILRFGKSNPQALDRNWNYSRRFSVSDPAAWLREAVASDALGMLLEGLRPAGPYYRALSAALEAYRTIARRGGWGDALPVGPTLKPGMGDSRVPQLRARLVISEGLLAREGARDNLRYDDALGAGVKAFQRRHGLTVDGFVGPRTLAALNVPLSARIDQLRINLERVRWVVRDLEDEFLAVNIAAFHAAYVEHGQVSWSGRAIVGRPFRQTPIFKGELAYLELNPTWTVPPTILREDILPKLRLDAAYLEEKRLRVVDPNGGPVDAADIDWANVNARRFPYFLRQDPGPHNALGRIKFIFPNAHAVYLHDTPSRSLFDAAERVFSSGCIRIENPFALAELLLDDPARWNQASLTAAVRTTKTQRVPLGRKVTVMLLYLTAFPGEKGEIQFRRDVYKRDPRALAALDGELTWTAPAKLIEGQ